MVEKISRRPLGSLVTICIMIVFVLVFVSCKSVLVFSVPPASGDWIVTGTESYYDEVIVLNGNLIVEDGGNLTFRKVTLKMNCTYNGQYNITINPGGKFYVLDGSVITSATPDKRIGDFNVWDGSTFRMNNSELHECGWLPPRWPTGLHIYSGDAIVENSLFSRNMWGINICSDEAVVRNNNITANDHNGIHAHETASPIICDNHISLNNGTGIAMGVGGSPTIYNNTITLNNRNGVEIGDESNPTIQDNIITLNKHSGIEGWRNCSPIIQSNNITSNLEYGINFKNESNPTIQDNIITLNKHSGIRLAHHCTGIIQRNIVTNNSCGINFWHYSNTTVQGNIIMGNQLGIHVHSHCNPLIQGNIITSNNLTGIYCNNNSLPEVHWNDIYGNESLGVENADPSVTVNATYNYWGDGPSTSAHVLYDPWLTESIVYAEITNPLSGQTVSSTVTVSTKVHAQNGIHKVEFYIDDQLEYTDYGTSCEWDWDTTQYTETEHKITIKAYDIFGLKTSTSTTVFVDNTPPTVSIKEPKPENIYYGTISVSVNATDNQEIDNVHVRVDNTEWVVMTYDPTTLLWKHDLNTTTLSDGQHTLMVLALDKASNPATPSTAFLTDNNPPTLTIQTPQSGITVGLTCAVNVQASDASGISKIEFYLKDVLVHTVTDTPYQWSWDTTKYPNGEYTIITKAYDTLGRVTTSETTVTVKNVESPWWQTHSWTIIQVLIAIGGLMLAIITYLTRKEKKK